MASKLRVVSWIVLTLLGVLVLLGALASAQVAYFSEQDQFGPLSMSELAGDRPEVVTALRARRGTAAAFASGYALLFLLIVLLPYRRGEVWAWWAVLLATLVTSGLILLRVPLLRTHLGLAAATIPLVVVIVALLLDAGRLKKSSP